MRVSLLLRSSRGLTPTGQARTFTGELRA
ncbi:MAG TPA: hypothetical protein VGI28_16085 [Stellaceae bacterium]